MKIILANEATKILHGEMASKKAAKTAKITFQSGGLGLDLPEIKVKPNQLSQGLNLINFFYENKLTHSISEARRIIDNYGIKLNNLLVDREKIFIDDNDFKGKILKISLGKKKHYIVKII